MGTQYPDLFSALSAEFEAHEVKMRPAPGGRQLSYITARTAMNRLDGVLGPENWWDSYQSLDNAVVCSLTVRLPSGETITKQDVGGHAGMADQGDDEKSAFSDAFKRAAAKFGVARYLYRDGVASFGGASGATAQVPPVSMPETPRPPANRPPARGGSGSGSNGSTNGPPKTGKQLFAWAKKQEEQHGDGLLRYLGEWGKRHGFASRLVDLSGDQVAQMHEEACRVLAERG